MSGGTVRLKHWNTDTMMVGNWAYSPTETPLEQVGVWFQVIQEEYRHQIWSSVASIEVWNPERPDCPPILREKSAMYYPGDRRILLRTYELCGGQLAHELGHHAQQQLRIGPETDRLGRALWSAFTAICGIKDLPLPNQLEQMSESFRYLFYPDTTRPPIDIPRGLKELFRAMGAAR